MFDDFVNALEESAPGGILTKDAVRRLYTHITELLEAGSVMNLTAITSEEEAAKLHTADSLYAAREIGALAGGNAATLIDVGSGGGFPALPIATVIPNVRVTALDATAKKCAFIAQTAGKCGVNIETLPERAEEASARLRETFDFATARAVARLNILLELCVPFVRVGGYFVAMKGCAAAEETREAERAASRLGVTLERAVGYEIEGGGQRSIIIYKKTSPTPKEYPRRYAQIKKKPL